MIDSGWNCTAATGSARCSRAITTPSAVRAVTSSSGGRLASGACSEWYRPTVTRSGRPAKIVPGRATSTRAGLPCTGVAKASIVPP